MFRDLKHSFVYLCICEYFLYVCGCPWKSDEDLCFFEIRVMGGCELLDVGARNQIQFLWKSRKNP